MQEVDIPTDATSTRTISIPALENQNHKTGLTRRGFLKTSAFVAGAAAFAGGTGCGSVAPVVNVAQGEETVVLQGCQHNGCGGCQGQVTVRDNKVVAINTWPENPEGKIPCARGRSHWQRIYTTERIQYPMRRIGDKFSDEWEQLSWDEALSLIAEKWLGYMKEFGPQSIAIFGTGALGGGYLNAYLIMRLKNLMMWTDASGCSDYAMAKGLNKVFGPASNTWGCPPFEMENAKYSKAVISWSGNISVASTYLWHPLMNAVEGGTKLVCVDPCYTVTAQKALL